jgi:hypothetical protein
MIFETAGKEDFRTFIPVITLPLCCARGARVKAGLHVRVNFRESYREHLATTFRRESKSWLAGSLRSLLRAPKLRDLSEYEVFVYTLE